MERTEVSSIHDAYRVYSLLLSDPQLCANNQGTLSNLSYIIDAHGLATVLNFYNSYSDIAYSTKLWKSNLFVIRMLAIVSSELVKFLRENNLFNDEMCKRSDEFNKISSLRRKIHQFRYTDFKNNIKNIDTQMGRSRDRLTPNLDICLEYLTDKTGNTLFGTNMYQFHFKEAKDQSTVDLMKRIIRAIEQRSFVSSSDFKIKRNGNIPKYRWEVYCYTDIVKNSHFENENVIDRVLLAYDDLCCVYEFFEYVIEFDNYLIQAPYLLYFFCKITAIILDETFDNFSKYIKHSPGDHDGDILKSILKEIDRNFISFCATLRNNLHYGQQAYLYLGTPDELYQMLNRELAIIKMLLENIRMELNITPSKTKLRFYRFLRWVQMPNNR